MQITPEKAQQILRAALLNPDTLMAAARAIVHRSVSLYEGNKEVHLSENQLKDFDSLNSLMSYCQLEPFLDNDDEPQILNIK